MGQLLAFGGDDESPWEVVGVVGDVRHTGLATDPEAVLYRSYRQNPGRPLSNERPQIAIRVDGDPGSVVPFLREAITAVYPDAALGDVMTMDSRLSASVTEPRFNAILLSVFGLTALALAGIGIYGVLAHAVSQRRHEIGVRAALGALRRDILQLVFCQAGSIVALGLVSGLLGALAATRFLDNLLFGVTATDPATFIAAPVLLAVVAALASYLPARRATRVDPVVALRHE